MNISSCARLAAAVSLLTLCAGPARSATNPLQFFEGRTESTGTVKVVFRKASRTHSIGHGMIEPDGSLSLVQHVDDEGKPPHERRWRVRQVGPGRFTGSMSDAITLVVIEKVGGRFRFQFKIQGGLAVEEWIAPLPDGMSASSTTIVRKMGIKVAVGQAIIRKAATR